MANTPMTPERVRTDALQPDDQIRHPHDWTLITVSLVETLDSVGSPLDFHNRKTDEMERGLRVTGTDADGETVHVDCAPSYLWHREGRQATTPMAPDQPTPVELTEQQLDALSAAGNRALNDHYHEDLCYCRSWPTSCESSGGYFMGTWDTAAFDIGLPAVLGVWERLRNDRHKAKVAELRADNKALRARIAELTAAPVDEAAEMAEAEAELEAMRREHPDPCRVPASPDCTCPLTPEQALRIERDRPESRTTHDCRIPLVRRFGCGHCPHEVCQDCDRCPHTCECTP
ncbi:MULTISPECIES: hypothetical protein [unclassified Streptomyces]|uniref:hypothetical protein n=1 Tax=unclassified Streptomyces TaxID=2593676 RepID=UPI000BF0DA56|nr:MULTISPECIES: hypothetical protein [unclassified Streptomyces]